jgi:hypothetical protein
MYPSGTANVLIGTLSRPLLLSKAANVGIGGVVRGLPLSFPNQLGNKISLWNVGSNNDYGIGISFRYHADLFRFGRRKCRQFFS